MSTTFQRASRMVDFAALHAPLRTKAQDIATAQGIGDLTVGTRLCVETHSQRVGSPGILSRILGFTDREHWTAIILTRDAVLTGIAGEKQGTQIFLLPLATLALDDVSVLEATGGPAVGLASPSLTGGGGGVGSWPVYVDSTATRDTVTNALRAALAERRAR